VDLQRWHRAVFDGREHLLAVGQPQLEAALVRARRVVPIFPGGRHVEDLVHLQQEAALERLLVQVCNVGEKAPGAGDAQVGGKQLLQHQLQSSWGRLCGKSRHR